MASRTFNRAKKAVGVPKLSKRWTDEDFLAVIAEQAASLEPSFAPPVKPSNRQLPPNAMRLVVAFLGHQPDQTVLDGLSDDSWASLAKAASALVARTGCSPLSESKCDPSVASESLKYDGCPLREYACHGYRRRGRGSALLP